MKNQYYLFIEKDIDNGCEWCDFPCSSCGKRHSICRKHRHKEGHERFWFKHRYRNWKNYRKTQYKE